MVDRIVYGVVHFGKPVMILDRASRGGVQDKSMAADQEPAVLVVDDEELTAELYKSILVEHGVHDVVVCSDPRRVMGILASKSFSAVLLDLNMPYISGKELLQLIKTEYPEIPIIILTSEDKVETAVECMKVGAFDFMAKPIDENRLVNAYNHAIRIRELQDELLVLSAHSGAGPLENADAFAEIVTASSVMWKIFRYIEAIGPSPKSVLITGESGTGKELIARAIHSVSEREGRFIPVNVSGLDDTVFSDTLFGHTRGAFTGADSERRGLIESAANGTLFLDEIGDLEIPAQIKLLRLLQEDEYYPLGSDTPRVSTVRIVAATNADLRGKQNDGSFRKDLYYRLMAHHIEIPPLRDRPQDIEPLVTFFLDRAAATLNKKRPTVPSELFTLLRTYTFPGNIRELESMVFDAMSRHESGVLSTGVFRAAIDAERDGTDPGGATDGLSGISYGDSFPTLSEVEEFFFSEALRRAEGNQTIAARLLGVSQSTLSRYLKNSR